MLLHRRQKRVTALDFSSITLLIMLIWFYAGLQDAIADWNFKTYSNYFYIAEPKWAIIVSSVLVLIILLQRPWILYRVPTSIVYWISLMIFVTIFWQLVFPDTYAAIEEFKGRRIAIAVLCLTIILLSNPGSATFARRALVPIGLTLIALNLLDFFFPFSRVPGRAAGLYMNANASAYMLCVTMVLTVTIVPIAWRMILLFLFGLGIFVTFSRSAILMYGVAVSVILVSGTAESTKRLPLNIVALASLVGAALLASTAQSIAEGFLTYLTKDAYSRLLFFASFSVEDDSGLSRLRIAARTFQEILDRPLAGHGLGRLDSYGGLGTHNTYLSLIWQHGLFGVAIVIAFFAALFIPVRGEEAVVRNLFICLVAIQMWFDHNTMSSPSMLMAYAILIASLETRRRGTSANDHHTHELIPFIPKNRA
jgi:hypothetical protein